MTLGRLPPEGRNLVLAGALISITLNPLMFAWASRFDRASNQPARVPSVAAATTLQP
jgi:CPA2 family monovalent cation:H+ antiporter-2